MKMLLEILLNVFELNGHLGDSVNNVWIILNGTDLQIKLINNNMINPAQLDFCIKNGYNVLFKGKHGVGKTAIILESFNRNKLKWKYFSASTMDPWVDFIGVPKEKIDEKGQSYLELIRPKTFQDDEVEAIFLDEFNRSPKKVRNAVMELIQFKSINGKKFNNLKLVWAAINPDEDDKYDVEVLDPAQNDRFHYHIEIPYQPNVPYFKQKYGEAGIIACTWWKEQNKDQQDKISPRRLDYAIDIFRKEGDLKFVLPKEANINKLLTELSSGSISKNLEGLYRDKNEAKTKDWLYIENNYNAAILSILKHEHYINYFVPLMPDEKIISLIVKHKNVEDFIFSDYNRFKSIINDLQYSGNNLIRERAISMSNHDGIYVDPRLKTDTNEKRKKYKYWENKIPTKENAQQMFADLMTIACHSHVDIVKRDYSKLEDLIQKSHTLISINALNIPVTPNYIQKYNTKYTAINNLKQVIDSF